jgi:sugar phosphate isomerase/epimerase
MRPRIAICYHAAPDPESAVALALEQGPYAGVELTLDTYDIEGSVRRGAAARAASADTLEVRYHFPLGALEISDPSLSGGGEALAVMVSAAEAMARHGGTHLTVHAALPGDASSGARFDRTVARLAELVSAAGAHGVTICLENLRWGATSEPDAFREVVERTGCAVTFDLGHAASSDAAARGIGPEVFARSVADRIEGAHIYGHENERHHPPRDLVSIEPSLDALSETACGWWLVELLDPDDIARTRRMLLDYLSREEAVRASLRRSSPFARK